MKDGFVKVGAAFPEIRPGDCAYNAERIIERIKSAYEEGVRLLVLPELCVTGSTCGDLFLHSALLNSAQTALARIAEATAELDIIYAVGVPMLIDSKLCSLQRKLSHSAKGAGSHRSVLLSCLRALTFPILLLRYV